MISNASALLNANAADMIAPPMVISQYERILQTLPIRCLLVGLLVKLRVVGLTEKLFSSTWQIFSCHSWEKIVLFCQYIFFWWRLFQSFDTSAQQFIYRKWKYSDRSMYKILKSLNLLTWLFLVSCKVLGEMQSSIGKLTITAIRWRKRTNIRKGNIGVRYSTNTSQWI